MDGEHYIRGLSDNELEKFTGLYRDMYTKAELNIADDEMARRKRARAAKASAPAPGAAPRPGEGTVPQVSVKPKAHNESAAKPPAANRALAQEQIEPNNDKNITRNTEIKPNLSLSRKNYRMPPPEGPAVPEAPPKLDSAFMYCTNCGNVCRLDDDYCPNCGYSVSLKDTLEEHPRPQPHVEVHGSTRRFRGGEYDSMDSCTGNGRWSCCDTDM